MRIANKWRDVVPAHAQPTNCQECGKVLLFEYVQLSYYDALTGKRQEEPSLFCVTKLRPYNFWVSRGFLSRKKVNEHDEWRLRYSKDKERVWVLVSKFPFGLDY